VGKPLVPEIIPDNAGPASEKLELSVPHPPVEEPPVNKYERIPLPRLFIIEGILPDLDIPRSGGRGDIGGCTSRQKQKEE
jgi:hypothetical protein